jgi:hypothetical protein
LPDPDVTITNTRSNRPGNLIRVTGTLVREALNLEWTLLRLGIMKLTGCQYPRYFFMYDSQDLSLEEEWPSKSIMISVLEAFPYTVANLAPPSPAPNPPDPREPGNSVGLGRHHIVSPICTYVGT